MEIRKQASLTSEEVKLAVVEFLLRKGFRSHTSLVNLLKDGNTNVYSFTEDEEWNIDTTRILAQPLKDLSKENAVIFNKIIARAPDLKLADILSKEITKGTTKANFDPMIKLSFFEDTVKNKHDGLTPENETALIKAFGEMGITLKSRKTPA